MKTLSKEKLLFNWLENNCGRRLVAGMTSSDVAFLKAGVALAEVWLKTGESDSESLGITAGFAACALGMQRITRRALFHAIAHVGDWGHRRSLWESAGLFELVERTSWNGATDLHEDGVRVPTSALTLGELGLAVWSPEAGDLGREKVALSLGVEL